MGLFSSLKVGKKALDTIDGINETVSKGIVNKDDAIKVKGDLAALRAELMLSGKGAAVTKYTINFLVSVVIGVLSWTYVFHPADMQAAIQYAQAAMMVLGPLIGVYGTGRALQKSKWWNPQ